MRYIFAAGAVILAIIVVGALCFFFVARGLAVGYTDYADEKEAKDELKAEAWRKDRIAVARSVNADSFDIKRIDEELTKKRYAKNLAYTELAALMSGEDATRLNLKIWPAGLNDEDLEKIESCEKEYAEARSRLETEASDLRAQLSASENRLADLTEKKWEADKLHEDSDKKVEEFKARIMDLARERKKINTELAGTPSFRSSGVRAKLENCDRRIAREQEKGVELKKVVDAIEARQHDIAAAIMAEEEKRGVIIDKQDETNRELELCRKIVEKTQLCLETTREICELKAQSLKTEELKEDKAIELKY